MPRSSSDRSKARHPMPVEIASCGHFVAKVLAVRAELQHRLAAVGERDRRDVVVRQFERRSDAQAVLVLTPLEQRRKILQPLTPALAERMRDVLNEGLGQV